MKIKEWLRKYWILIIYSLIIILAIIFLTWVNIAFGCDSSIHDCYNCTGNIMVW